MEPVCFDIMEMIGEQYKIIKETNKNKKIYRQIIKHLDYYFDDYGSVNPEFIKDGDIRVDTQFIEYEDLFNTNHYQIIHDKYDGCVGDFSFGGSYDWEDQYDEWCLDNL